MQKYWALEWQTKELHSAKEERTGKFTILKGYPHQ
jgi:hypothetical protein